MAKKYDLLISARGETSDAERKLQNLQRNVMSAGRKMQSVGRTMTRGLTLPILGIAAASVKLASDAGETASKMQVTFGAAMPAINKQLDAFAKATGASRYQLREQATTIGALLKPMNLGAKATADMSVKVTKLATDLSSFNNVPVGDALNALRSGLTGETEPLKRFGILINAAAVETEALRIGLIKKGQTMTEQQKVQARYSLMMQQTRDAQGDAARTSDSFANQMKATKNALIDTGISIGNILLPMLLQVMPKVQQAASWFGTLSSKTQGWVVGLGLVAAALGPVIMLMGSLTVALGGLVTVVALVTAPMVALAAAVVAVGAASAALLVHERNKQTEFRRTAERIREQVAEMRTLRDMQADLAGARVGLREAALGVERAERTYRDAVKQTGRGSLEAREAAVALQRARNNKEMASRNLLKVERELGQEGGRNIAIVNRARQALLDEAATRQQLADLQRRLYVSTSGAERRALSEQIATVGTHLKKLERAHKANQETIADAVRRGVVTRKELLSREGAHLAPAAREAGRQAGQAMGEGLTSAFRSSLSMMGSVISSYSDDLTRLSAQAAAAANSAGRGKSLGDVMGKKRGGSGRSPWQGINIVAGSVLSGLGTGLGSGSVLQYSGLAAGGSPYEINTDDDGRQSVSTNNAIKKFIEARKKAAQARLEQVLKMRVNYLKAIPVWKKRRNQIQAASKKRKLTNKEKSELGRLLNNLAAAPGHLNALESEIISLGGQIQADTESLKEPSVDNSDADERVADRQRQEQHDADNLVREALGDISLEEEAKLRAINEIRARYGLPPVSGLSEIRRGLAGDSGSPMSGIGIDAVFGGSTGRGVAYTANGGIGNGVTIQQYFSSEPNMGAAAAAASWSFYPIMAAAPMGAA
jgi:hypothetical protein